jgi:hypothetical protein
MIRLANLWAYPYNQRMVKKRKSLLTIQMPILIFSESVWKVSKASSHLVLILSLELAL